MVLRRGTVILIVIWLPLSIYTFWRWPNNTWAPTGVGYDAVLAKSTDVLSAPNPGLSSAALRYFGQVYSLDRPVPHGLSALEQRCQETVWSQDDVYLDCGYIIAGLTTISSSLKVCFKMAIEAGAGLVLPSMPLRDSSNLKEFNLMNEEAYMSYDKWFDVDHLISRMHQYCPQMKIVRSESLDGDVLVKYRWTIDIRNAPDYVQYLGTFWPGQPFRSFFDAQYETLKFLASGAEERDHTQNQKMGATIIRVDSEFLIYRITDDPTGQELRLWNDLAHLIRFKKEVRELTQQILNLMQRPFYGVHFRVESDTIWSSLENQLNRDLDALDKAWKKYNKSSDRKPLIYLACGDQDQIAKFVTAGAERGWEVTHKWHLAHMHSQILSAIDALAFDFQGAIDMGVMIKSDFFLGITGSAYSSTIANIRDETGRYRGSSFSVTDDKGARSHLFNDGESRVYPCCL